MSASGGGSAGSEPAGDDLLVHVNLNVKSQDGDEVFFKIKEGTPVRKLMSAYCDRTSQSPESVASDFSLPFLPLSDYDCLWIPRLEPLQRSS